MRVFQVLEVAVSNDVILVDVLRGWLAFENALINTMSATIGCKLVLLNAVYCMLPIASASVLIQREILEIFHSLPHLN